MKRPLSILAFTVLASSATAELQSVRLHAYKHWTVDYLYSDAGDGWNACNMSVWGDGISFNLNVDGNGKADIQVFDAKANYDDWTGGSKFQLKIDKHPRWNMPAYGDGNSLFVDLRYDADANAVDRLIYEIQQGMDLYIYEFEASSYFYRFSLRGSKAASIAMAQNCVKDLRPFSLEKSQPKKKRHAVPGKDNPVPGLPSPHYELRMEDTSVGKVLYVRGTIAHGFADDLISHGSFDYLVIEESNGGLLGEALKAGTFLRENGVATSLDGACASACVELYAGGSKRYYSENARFGIHAMAVDGDETSLAKTQSILSDRVKYFEAGGVDGNIVVDSLDTPANEIRWLSITQAQEYGLIDQ